MNPTSSMPIIYSKIGKSNLDDVACEACGQYAGLPFGTQAEVDRVEECAVLGRLIALHLNFL